MKRDIFVDYFLNKRILISFGKGYEYAFEVAYSLADMYGVRVKKGAELLQPEHLEHVANVLGKSVPAPFYHGFPQTVRKLVEENKKDLFRFDQLVHYARTYGLGDFSQPGRALFEEDFERTAFNEDVKLTDFSVITEEEAKKMLFADVDDMLIGTRPISDMSFEMVKLAIARYGYEVRGCACKDTAFRLLVATRDLRYADYFSLSDVVPFVERLLHDEYPNQWFELMTLANRDRRLIEAVLDCKLEGDFYDAPCYEKRKKWKGLLHHIHYKPKNEAAREFVSGIRSGENKSAYSLFEREVANGNILAAARVLTEKKGSGAFLRSLNYLISRSKTEDEVNALLDMIDGKNATVLVQLLLSYGDEYAQPGRIFTFNKFNKLCVHAEDEYERTGRCFTVSGEYKQRAKAVLQQKLREALKNRIGKVYISPEMEKMALPVSEGTTMGGYGVLTKGSRLTLPEGKVFRAFTYWEKVNDIDLSAIGIGDNDETISFSWQNMYARMGKGMIYSGDQTSGFDGGSEYFDVDIDKFKEEYPTLNYIVFAANVYSRSPFSACSCTAGYMLREALDSGEVYEPKTVKTAFNVTCASTQAFLFGIDLNNREIVWLNLACNADEIVAYDTPVSFMTRYFGATKVINLRSFYEMLATEVVDTPEEADVVVSDTEEADGKTVIRSCDFSKTLAYLNGAN